MLSKKKEDGLRMLCMPKLVILKFSKLKSIKPLISRENNKNIKCKLVD